MSECERHKGKGIVDLGDVDMCYGCWCEQFDFCPLCGEIWDKCKCEEENE